MTASVISDWSSSRVQGSALLGSEAKPHERRKRREQDAPRPKTRLGEYREFTYPHSLASCASLFLLFLPTSHSPLPTGFYNRLRQYFYSIVLHFGLSVKVPIAFFLGMWYHKSKSPPHRVKRKEHETYENRTRI